MRDLFAGCVAAFLASAAIASNDPGQDAIDACIDHRMSLGGATGGEVLRSAFSQAGTEVILMDGAGEVFRCIAYADGSIGDFAAMEGADPDALRASGTIEDAQERVQFAPGTSGAEIVRTFDAGEARQYILGAGAGQTLSVQVTPRGGAAYYVIRNPDDTILLDGTGAETPYRGQLGQSGDHVVEVVSQDGAPQDIAITFGIE